MKGAAGKGYKGKEKGVQTNSWTDRGAHGAGLRSISSMDGARFASMKMSDYHGTGGGGAGGLGIWPLDTCTSAPPTHTSNRRTGLEQGEGESNENPETQQCE